MGGVGLSRRATAATVTGAVIAQIVALLALWYGLVTLAVVGMVLAGTLMALLLSADFDGGEQ